jgi:hypothetical protein
MVSALSGREARFAIRDRQVGSPIMHREALIDVPEEV